MISSEFEFAIDRLPGEMNPEMDAEFFGEINATQEIKVCLCCCVGIATDGMDARQRTGWPSFAPGYSSGLGR